jgi:anti-anti-sigma factor
MDTNWQMEEQPEIGAAGFESDGFELSGFESDGLESDGFESKKECHKESKLKLSLETRNRGEIMIVYCQGRIVYRDEAAVLARVAGEVLQQAGKLVLDLSGVSSIDSAGIGELALLQNWAQQGQGTLKLAGPSPLVSTLLELTNLNSVLEVYPSVEAALESFREEQVGEQYGKDQVCADC